MSKYNPSAECGECNNLVFPIWGVENIPISHSENCYMADRHKKYFRGGGGCSAHLTNSNPAMKAVRHTTIQQSILAYWYAYCILVSMVCWGKALEVI